MDSNLPSAIRQSAVFNCVRREFVQCHGHCKAQARAETKLGTFEMEPSRGCTVKRLKSLRYDLVEACTLPVLARQHVVCARECNKAALDVAAGLSGGECATQALRHNGLDGRKRVLHTMIELVDQ